MKTQQQINVFLAADQINLENIDTSASIKTNFLIVKNNFNKILVYVNTLLDFVKNLYQTLDISNLTGEVLNQLQKDKIVFYIDSNLSVNSSVLQTIKSNSYKVNRISEIILEITSETIMDWDVDNLIICVKNNNNQIIYPTITTSNNKITIYFNDNLSSNYKIIIL